MFRSVSLPKLKSLKSVTIFFIQLVLLFLHSLSSSAYAIDNLWMFDVGFPSVRYEYVLLSLDNEEAVLVCGRAE